MTAVESFAALERIQLIERFAQEPCAIAFGGSPWVGWDEASRRLAVALDDAAEMFRAFIRVEDPDVGIIVTGWTGDVNCVWKGPVTAGTRESHLLRFQDEFAFRIRLGHTLAAAVRAALAISRAAAAPLTAVSAVRAAWELVDELERWRTPARPPKCYLPARNEREEPG